MQGTSRACCVVIDPGSTWSKSGTDLKLKVMAEGVDSEVPLHLLRVLGCDEMQGFLFSQAVSHAAFEAWYPAGPPLV